MATRKKDQKVRMVEETRVFPFDANGNLVSELKRIIAYCLEQSWKPLYCFLGLKACHLPRRVDHVRIRPKADVPRGSVLVKYLREVSS